VRSTGRRRSASRSHEDRGRSCRQAPWRRQRRRKRSCVGECWADTRFFDLFDLTTGDFLASVPAPEIGFLAPLFANDEIVLAAVADDLGTVRLKQYAIHR
jgi:hypothetical protein